MTRTRQFGVNEVRFAEPDPQFDPNVGLKKRSGQYRVRSLRSMKLPQVAYVLEPWLSFRGGRLKANGHG
jgi:hypothetical protein